jgi:hypothetical protein
VCSAISDYRAGRGTRVRQVDRPRPFFISARRAADGRTPGLESPGEGALTRDGPSECSRDEKPLGVYVYLIDYYIYIYINMSPDVFGFLLHQVLLA